MGLNLMCKSNKIAAICPDGIKKEAVLKVLKKDFATKAQRLKETQRFYYQLNIS